MILCGCFSTSSGNRCPLYGRTSCARFSPCSASPGGIGSLLLLVGLGEGFGRGQENELATLGQNIMFLFPGRVPAVEGSTQSAQLYLLLWSAFEENASGGDIHLYIDSAIRLWSTVILSFVGIVSGMLPAIKPRLKRCATSRSYP